MLDMRNFSWFLECCRWYQQVLWIPFQDRNQTQKLKRTYYIYVLIIILTFTLAYKYIVFLFSLGIINAFMGERSVTQRWEVGYYQLSMLLSNISFYCIYCNVSSMIIFDEINMYHIMCFYLSTIQLSLSISHNTYVLLLLQDYITWKSDKYLC